MKIFDNIKLIREKNSLRNENETLKNSIKDGLYEQFFRDINKLENYGKLKKENKRLREKNKKLKEAMHNGSTRDRKDKSFKRNVRK